jgi:hypothetical protein
MPIILVTQEAEIWRIEVGGPPKQKVCNTFSQLIAGCSAIMPINPAMQVSKK